MWAAWPHLLQSCLGRPLACWDRCGQPAPVAKPACLTGLGTAGQLPSAARPLHGVPGLLSLHWPECQTTGDGSSDISAQTNQSFLASAIASKDPWHAPTGSVMGRWLPLRVAPEHWAHLLRQVVRWGEIKLSKSPSLKCVSRYPSNLNGGWPGWYLCIVSHS